MSPEVEKFLNKEGWEQEIRHKVTNDEFEELLIQNKGNFSSFKKAWTKIGGTNSETVFELLIEQHQKPKRKYHNITHVSYMLQGFKNACSKIPYNETIEIAIWFHDAIYDPLKEDNEEQSAELAYNQCILNNIEEKIANNIKQLIMATKHGLIKPKNTEEKIIADLDLAVLGLDFQTFKKYGKAIKEEFTIINEKEYNKIQLKMLNDFLKQKELFHTEYFKNKYEKQARQNLKQAIEETITNS